MIHKHSDHKHSDHPFRQACKGVFKRVERWLFVDRQWYFFGSSWYHLFFADLFERFSSWLLFLGAGLFFWTIFLATLLKSTLLDNFLGFLATLLGASSGSSSWLLSWTLLGYSWATLFDYPPELPYWTTPLDTHLDHSLLLRHQRTQWTRNPLQSENRKIATSGKRSANNRFLIKQSPLNSIRNSIRNLEDLCKPSTSLFRVFWSFDKPVCVFLSSRKSVLSVFLDNLIVF